MKVRLDIARNDPLAGKRWKKGLEHVPGKVPKVTTVYHAGESGRVILADIAPGLGLYVRWVDRNGAPHGHPERVVLAPGERRTIDLRGRE